MKQTGNSMLFIGDQWLGSNARSLSMALRRNGWLVEILDPGYFLPQPTYTKFSLILRKLMNGLYRFNLNREILYRIDSSPPAIVFVYKGTAIRPDTIQHIANSNSTVVLYYPDFSLYASGKNIPQCIPLYDAILTAKSFGEDDMRPLGAKETHLVLHGCDTDVHRPIPQELLPKPMRCEVAFIGMWSPHKEAVLDGLLKRIPGLDLKIWGKYWDRSNALTVRERFTGRAVFGDQYAAAIQSARINLGLLSEKRFGASSGDLTTARTFEIPGCGAFMLHQRNEEVLGCFEEGKEIECFDSIDELAEKVHYYLDHEQERATIAKAGYERCVEEHTYDHRAEQISGYLHDLVAIE